MEVIRLGKATLLALALAFDLAAPASAQVIVHDPVTNISVNANLTAQLAKDAVIVEQAISLVQQGQIVLQRLQNFGNPSEIAATASSVSGMLTQAQQQLASARCSATSAPSCQIANQVTQQQIAGIATDLQAIANLQTLSRGGVAGTTSAIQSLNEAMLQQQSTLQQLRQLELARALQQQIDEQTLDAKIQGTSSGNAAASPWLP